MGILFVLSFIFIFLSFLFSYKDKDAVFTNLRSAFIKSSLTVSFLVVIFTEFLSFFRILTSTYICWLWGVTFFISLLFFISSFLKNGSSFKDLQFYKIILFIKNESLVIKIIISLISIIILSVFCVAFTINNNYDSYTYHLPRVEHWIQNGNVDFFQTNNIRQLYLAPFAEYFILNIRLLSGNALFINLIQFFSWFNCLLLASMVAKSLGLFKRGQLVSLVLALTIPMALLQSTTTQTDLVISFFLISFIYFGISIIKSKKISAESLLFLCFSFSLGILTKSTFYIFALPFCMLFGVYYLKLFKLRTFYILISIVSVFLLLNTSFLYRNYIQFGSPLGPQKGSTFYLPSLNEKFGIKETLSNSSKNIGLHLALPNDYWNKGVDSIVIKFNQIIDYPLNSTSTSWFGIKYSTNFSLTHDTVGNFFHIILFVLALLIFLIRLKFIDKFVIFYLASLLSSSVFFAFILKWQPWQTRLDLPLFFIAAPFLAYALSLIKWKVISNVICIFILGISIAILFIFNPIKPILGENSVFIKDSNSYILDYGGAIKIESILESNKIYNVGLILGSDFCEWQYWLLSHDRRFEHVYFSKDLIRTGNFDSSFNYRALIISNFYLNDPHVSGLINEKNNTSEILKINENETLVIFKNQQDKNIIY
jgi:hypothetical protein